MPGALLCSIVSRPSSIVPFTSTVLAAPCASMKYEPVTAERPVAAGSSFNCITTGCPPMVPKKFVSEMGDACSGGVVAAGGESWAFASFTVAPSSRAGVAAEDSGFFPQEDKAAAPRMKRTAGR